MNNQQKSSLIFVCLRLITETTNKLRQEYFVIVNQILK